MKPYNNNYKCEDCIHYDVCKMYNVDYVRLEDSKFTELCFKFSDKKNWLHTSIPIGTDVIILDTSGEKPVNRRIKYSWYDVLEDIKCQSDECYKLTHRKFKSYEEAEAAMKQYLENQQMIQITMETFKEEEESGTDL